jgi:preprotein translocase subunit SecA
METSRAFAYDGRASAETKTSAHQMRSGFNRTTERTCPMQSISYPSGRIETAFYLAHTDAANHAAMDADLKAAEARGGTLVKRAKIGRNATCPCGSGRKFKKCCIRKALTVG